MLDVRFLLELYTRSFVRKQRASWLLLSLLPSEQMPSFL
jgi:hypothetical protein